MSGLKEETTCENGIIWTSIAGWMMCCTARVMRNVQQMKILLVYNIKEALLLYGFGNWNTVQSPDTVLARSGTDFVLANPFVCVSSFLEK